MTITDWIKKLEELKEQHGDLDLAVYKYAGGDDECYLAVPEYDAEINAVVVEARGFFFD